MTNSINKEILKLWAQLNEDGGDDLTIRCPLFYTSNLGVKKNTILFVGLNPSYNESFLKLNASQLIPLFNDWRKIDDDNIKQIIEFDNSLKKIDKITLKTKYSYFQKFQDIVEYLKRNRKHNELLEWEHLDLFLIRITSQAKFKDLIYEKDDQKILNSFAKEQIKLFKILIDLIKPKLIVVANAYASKIFKEEIYKNSISFDNENGYHLIRLEECREIPVFFSSMLTGQRALDNHSFERLCWHIDKALNNHNI
ncbi:MAG: hypothetical protein A2003_13365 [Acinetobacter sp. GWC1_38_13]|uniref:hypothetical protein n=1 Tax=Acinetobacter sp. GWC1_38_13 TaxID=1797234 RepID=UPI0008C7B66C|nr:hypothetical protein [Acinetobacter sp. GWC1_38_13]OFW44811.1 MAG: hypothetical protein A2003_13365 [Acinetobacter sp. GWC1_38_13]HAV57971.1 hypothetical protein [Acinetobacter junii]